MSPLFYLRFRGRVLRSMIRPLWSAIPRVVIARVQGGIGNQLFQYAAAETVAARSGADRILVLRSGGASHIGTPDLEAMLGRLEALPAPIARLWPGTSRGPSRRWTPIQEAGIRRLTAPWRMAPDGAFAPANAPRLDRVQTRRCIYMDGYFQHPSWYSDSLAAVKERLVARAPDWVATAVRNREVPGIALHVRRGDYEQAGWTLPLSYYDSAVARIAPRAGTSFVVCSDDADVERRVSAALRTRGLVPFTGEAMVADRTATGDFWKFALGRHAVVSNSTFAWWAAAAGDVLHASDPGRIVCIPDPWLPTEGRFDCRPGAWVNVPSGIGV